MRRVRERLHDGEDGFTIIEILIASIILVLASLAVFMTFASAIKNVQRSRESQVSISVAQREMERVRVIPYDEIRLTSEPEAPRPELGVRDPRSRVLTFGVAPSFDLDRKVPLAPQPLELPVEDGPEGEVAGESTEVRSEDGTEMTVFRFVTCEEEVDGTCLAKRVIIDVLPSPKTNLANYQRNYYELQSTIVHPELGAPQEAEGP
jgi:prepilin-type N-terminal cleavage/methylation domain-containing protein